MNTYLLSKKELFALWDAHRHQKDKNAADRIKVVYSLGMGLSVESLCVPLMLTENTIRHYFDCYRKGGIGALLATHYADNHHYLEPEELKELEKHLEAITYLRVEDIIEYVRKTYRVLYSITGMTELLHRLKFVYKKPKAVPRTVPMKEQKEFIKKYYKTQRECGPEDKIYFMDATHPHYQAVAGYGWIKRGQEKVLPTTLKQSVLSINGAVNIQALKGVFKFHQETLTEETTLDLLEKMRKQQPFGKMFIICDKAGYYASPRVKEFAKVFGIELIYLPPRSPQLNLIERLWHYFRKKVLYNRHYETKEAFVDACQRFFQNFHKHKNQLRTLLADNFQEIVSV